MLKYGRGSWQKENVERDKDREVSKVTGIMQFNEVIHLGLSA